MKFVKLTVMKDFHSGDTYPLILNANRIVELVTFPEGTIVTTVDSKNLYCVEKMDDLQKELMGE